MKTTITERGQVSIPAALRRDMHLEAGQMVVWEQLSATECRLIIEKPRKVTPDPFAAIGFAQRHGMPAATTEEWLKILREGEED
ncbi:MAG TPA: AbrB/MazE/SpoVT family DNA-binding domain-containing protein [Chthoniobacterales bacterium]